MFREDASDGKKLKACLDDLALLLVKSYNY